MSGPKPLDSPVAGAGPAGARARLAPAGFPDELGERSLSFDPASETLVETLWLKREFSDDDFEAALRARVAAVGRLRHNAFATVQAVNRTAAGLSLVSAYASGRRLSELAPIDNAFAVALDVIRRITPALATLHESGPGVGHGALSLNRLVLTRDRRIILVEHVLAPALESLHWSRPRFNDLGLVVADAVPVRLDERNDLRQLGWAVMTLLLGRTLEPSDYPGYARTLLAEAALSHTPLETTKLGEWLERTLQLGPNAFASASEAAAAFDALASDDAIQAAESAGALLAFHDEAPAAVEPALSAPTVVVEGQATSAGAKEQPAIRPIDRILERPAKLRAVPASPTPVSKAPVKARTRIAVWIAAAVTVIALVEAGAILRLLVSPSVVVPPPPATEIAAPTLPPTFLPTAPAPEPVASPTPSPLFRPPAAVVPTGPAGARFGGFSVTSAIELQVFNNGALVGSTTGPVAIGEGRHTLDFVNQALGFRVTQVVDVVGGQLTPVRIAIPNGRVSINAVPWADVTIDGIGAGETPIGNLALPIGSHEIVFRHPDLGEARQTVLVRADVPTRVTQNYK